MADGTGVIQYDDDPTAVGLTQQFYRLRFPWWMRSLATRKLWEDCAVEARGRNGAAEINDLDRPAGAPKTICQ